MRAIHKFNASNNLHTIIVTRGKATHDSNNMDLKKTPTNKVYNI